MKEIQLAAMREARETLLIAAANFGGLAPSARDRCIRSANALHEAYTPATAPLLTHKAEDAPSDAAAVDVAGLMALIMKFGELSKAHGTAIGLYGGDFIEMGRAADSEKAALESALRLALAAREGWQPIETAPKDGTDILLAIIDADHSYIDHVERGYFEVVAEDEEDGPWDIRDGEPWCSYEGRPEGLYWCYACAPDDFNRRGIRFLDSSDCLKYTHWMPLPAAAPKGTT